LVMKAQVLAGGRGKGHFDHGFKGGVRVIYSYATPRAASLHRLTHYIGPPKPAPLPKR
jgi:succinyl-CoA synthetase beta subunit